MVYNAGHFEMFIVKPAQLPAKQSGAGTMKMSKVSNQTNSQDPQAVSSRVFVGNLNTFQCSKTDVERMFQRYGRLAGISMHKGYAFVQFGNPFDARSACLGEDGRTVLGQVLDVNMVAEPKPHQTGRKRQNNTKTGNDWDYYYDSYYASTAFANPVRLSPQVKRPRLMSGGHQGRTATPAKQQAWLPAGPHRCQSPPRPAPISHQFKIYSNPDILICGNCREMFTELLDLLQHKKSYCKLRFTCKCRPQADEYNCATDLLCVICKDHFSSAWELMVHVQAAHMVNIYELAGPETAPPSECAEDPQNSPSCERVSPDPQEIYMNGSASSPKTELINANNKRESTPESQEIITVTQNGSLTNGKLSPED